MIKKILMFVCIISCVYLRVTMFAKYYRLPIETKLTNEQLIKQITNIAKTYGKNYSYCEINVDVNTGEKYVTIKLYQDPSKSEVPIELYSIFDSYIYIHNRSLPYEIAGISCYFEESKYIEGSLNEYIFVSYAEFQKLYDDIDVINKNEQETVKELADKWLSKEFYYRYNLQLNNEHAYKQLLLTKWRISQMSPDEKYEMVYIPPKNNEDNSIRIWLYSGVASRQIQAIPIMEKGLLYGAWDEQNNIWLYGETTGIQQYIFDGKDAWVKQDIDLDKMPYPIKKVAQQSQNENK